MVVVAHSGPSDSDETTHTEDVWYSGAENSLIMARDFRLQYCCTFIVSMARSERRVECEKLFVSLLLFKPSIISPHNTRRQLRPFVIFINTAFSLQDFQYPFDKQDCAGTIDLPWKNNSTVALTKSRNPITILGILETDLRLLISCFPGERVLAT